MMTCATFTIEGWATTKTQTSLGGRPRQWKIDTQRPSRSRTVKLKQASHSMRSRSLSLSQGKLRLRSIVRSAPPQRWHVRRQLPRRRERRLKENAKRISWKHYHVLCSRNGSYIADNALHMSSTVDYNHRHVDVSVNKLQSYSTLPRTDSQRGLRSRFMATPSRC